MLRCSPLQFSSRASSTKRAAAEIQFPLAMAVFRGQSLLLRPWCPSTWSRAIGSRCHQHCEHMPLNLLTTCNFLGTRNKSDTQAGAATGHPRPSMRCKTVGNQGVAVPASVDFVLPRAGRRNGGDPGRRFRQSDSASGAACFTIKAVSSPLWRTAACCERISWNRKQTGVLMFPHE